MYKNSNSRAETDFHTSKRRVDGALKWLRDELIEMRQQDVSILRQLNQIQQTIHILSIQRRPRTFSASSLTSLDADRAQDVTSPKTPRSRTLQRLNSLPVNTRQESFDDAIDDDYDEDDVLEESFDSAASDRPITHQSVHALCTLPRARHPRLGYCVWPSIPEHHGDRSGPGTPTGSSPGTPTGQTPPGPDTPIALNCDPTLPGTPPGPTTPTLHHSPAFTASRSPALGSSDRGLDLALRSPCSLSSEDPFPEESLSGSCHTPTKVGSPGYKSSPPASRSLNSSTSTSYSPLTSPSCASYTLPSPDLLDSSSPCTEDMPSIGSADSVFLTRSASNSSYQSSVFLSADQSSVTSQDFPNDNTTNDEAPSGSTSSVDSVRSQSADTNASNRIPQGALINKAFSSITNQDIRSVVRRRQVSDYEVSYEKLLKRSSQIWKEVQTQQEGGGKVDEKKMAALKLFL